MKEDEDQGIQPTATPISREDQPVDPWANVRERLNKAEFSELIEKETHTRARSANHIGERCLANFGNDRVMFPFFAKVGQ